MKNINIIFSVFGIETEYKKLKENNITLDKPYSDKIKNIIKENSKENQK